jgi:predicted HicB family RNase H-like nuclease
MDTTFQKSRHAVHKNKLFQTRFTPELHERIRVRAEQECMSMSTWVTRLILVALNRPCSLVDRKSG